MKYLSFKHINHIHTRIIKTSGGSDSIRDRGAVESAIAQPMMTFNGEELYPTLIDKASALGYSLNKNLGFVDGNKRTAHAAVEMFLLMNGFEIHAEYSREWRRELSHVPISPIGLNVTSLKE